MRKPEKYSLDKAFEDPEARANIRAIFHGNRALAQSNERAFTNGLLGELVMASVERPYPVNLLHYQSGEDMKSIIAHAGALLLTSGARVYRPKRNVLAPCLPPVRSAEVGRVALYFDYIKGSSLGTPIGVESIRFGEAPSNQVLRQGMRITDQHVYGSTEFGQRSYELPHLTVFVSYAPGRPRNGEYSLEPLPRKLMWHTRPAVDISFVDPTILAGIFEDLETAVCHTENQAAGLLNSPGVPGL